MPRRRKITKRLVPGDPIHNSVHVQMLINKVMMHGKKSVAENIVYRALEVASQRLTREAVDVFEQVLRNSSLPSKFAQSASVVRPIKCQWKLRATAGLPWQFVGC